MALAFALAGVFHLLVLAIKLSFNDPRPLSELALSVQLVTESVQVQDEPDTPKQDNPKPVAPEQKLINDRPPEVASIPDDIIVASPSPEQARQEALNLDVTGKSFQQFLLNETDSYRQNNSDSVGAFGQTFDEAPKESNQVSGDTKKARAHIRGVGVFATEGKNGKRSCYAQIFNMLEITGTPSYVAKGCTRPKKFDLKMNKPNNG